MEVNGRGKHSSLLRTGNNYGCKMFYSRGPRISIELEKAIHSSRAFVTKLFTTVINTTIEWLSNSSSLVWLVRKAWNLTLYKAWGMLENLKEADSDKHTSLLYRNCFTAAKRFIVKGTSRLLRTLFVCFQWSSEESSDWTQIIGMNHRHTYK